MAARLEGSHHQVVRRVVTAVTLTLPTPGDETGLTSRLTDRLAGCCSQPPADGLTGTLAGLTDVGPVLDELSGGIVTATTPVAHHDECGQDRGGQDDDDAADRAGEPGRHDRHADGCVDGRPDDRPGGCGHHVAAQRHAGHARGDLDEALQADGQEGHRYGQHAPAGRPRLGAGVHGRLEQ